MAAAPTARADAAAPTAHADVAAPTARAAALAALPVGRAVLELAWPGIVEQSIRVVGQLTVFAFVAHLGAVATAGVGASFNLLFLLFPVWNGFAIGTIALVSRRMGEGRPDAAGDALRQSLVLAAALGVASGAAFAAGARPALLALGAEPAVADAGTPFLALVGGLNVFQTLSIISIAAIRAAGDTRTPMWLSVGSTVAMIPLAYLLIDAAGLGVLGAAISIVAVNVLFAVATLFVLLRGRAGLRLGGGPWVISRETSRTLSAIGLPAAAESGLFSVGILALGFLVFRLGTEAYAAHQILFQIEQVSFLPVMGLSAAASTLVGQALGMRDGSRATRVGWSATRLALTWTVLIGAAFALFPALFLGVFTGDAAVVAAGTGATIALGLAQPAQAVNFTLGASLRGAGDTRYTLAATVVNWFVVRLPLAALLSFPLGFGLAGVWLAIAIDYVVRSALLAVRFRGARWQRHRY